MGYSVSVPASPAQIHAGQARERDEQFMRNLRKRIDNALHRAKQEQDAVLAVSFWHPSAGELSVFSIGFDPPDLLSIGAVDANDQEWAILAHVATVQLTLRIIKATGENPPRRRFGFTD